MLCTIWEDYRAAQGPDPGRRVQQTGMGAGQAAAGLELASMLSKRLRPRVLPGHSRRSLLLRPACASVLAEVRHAAAAGQGQAVTIPGGLVGLGFVEEVAAGHGSG